MNRYREEREREEGMRRVPDSNPGNLRNRGKVVEGKLMSI